MITDVIDPRFSLFAGSMLSAFTGKESPDNSDCLLLLPLIKPCRRIDFFNSFLRSPGKNTVGKDTGHVLSPFQIAGILKRCYGCFDPCLYLRNTIVPSCLPRNLQGRVGYRRPKPGDILNCFPDLLYLLDGQLCLIQEDKVFIKVLFVIEDKAISNYVFITTCPACFLDIVFERIGYLIVHHHANILFIYPHSECGGGNHDWNIS